MRIEFNGKSYDRAFVRSVAEVQRKQSIIIPPKGEFKLSEITQKIRQLNIGEGLVKAIIIALKKAGIIQYEDLEHDTSNRLVFEREVMILPIIAERENCRQDLSAALQTHPVRSADIERILGTIDELYNRDFLMEVALKKIYASRFYDFSLPRTKRASPGDRIISNVCLFSALEQLGLISDEAGKTSRDLSQAYNAAKNELREQINDLAAGEFAELLSSGAADTIPQAVKMVKESPKVEGFESSSDAANIPDAAIRRFISEAFSEEVLRRLLIRRIEKHPEYHVVKTSEEGKKKLEAAGIKIGTMFFADMCRIEMARTRQEYEAIAQILEGINDPSKLSHVYNGIGNSGVGQKFGYNEIRIGNLSLKHYSSREFYEGLESFSEQEKTAAFLFGLLAHEVSHKYVLYSRDILMHDIMIDYDEGTKSERKEKPCVTDYVRWHKDIYKSDGPEILEDDFCEAIHADVVNPEYLKREFPARYIFIKEHLPFIKAGVAVEIVKGMRLTRFAAA